MTVPAEKPNQGQIETISSNVLPLDEYHHRGLRVLARIIARVHMKNALNKAESKDSGDKV